MKITSAFSAITAFAIVAGAVLTVSAPAQAVTSCTKTQEVCRDSRSNFSGSKVTFKTTTSNRSSGSAEYQVLKGDAKTGKKVCSGTMGYNQTKSCSIGSYSGRITFVFFKGQNTLTTVSVS